MADTSSDTHAVVGILIALLGATWGAMTVGLEALVILNKTRNRVFDLAATTPKAISIFHDWVPLWLGVLVFYAVVTGIVLYIPEFFSGVHSDRDFVSRARRICYAVAFLPAMTFVGWLVGGLGDLVYMVWGKEGDGRLWTFVWTGTVVGFVLFWKTLHSRLLRRRLRPE